MKTRKLVGASVLFVGCLLHPAWLSSQTPSQSEPKRVVASARVQEILDSAAKLSQPADLLAAADSAIKVAEQSSDHEGLALAYRLRAKTLEGSDRSADAVGSWRLAGDEFGKAGDTPSQIEALSSAGVLLVKANPAEAEHLFDTALAAGNSTKLQTLELARAYYAAGNPLMNLTQLGPARKFYVAGLELAERLAPDSIDVALLCEGLGRVSLVARDDPQTAMRYFERGLAIGEKITPDSFLVARFHYRIGNLYLMKSEFPDANHHFELALKISETLEQSPSNRRLLAGVLNSLGIIANRTGNLFESRGYFERVAAIKAKEPEDLDTALVLLNVGNVDKDLGDWDSAERYYKRALAIEQRLAPNSPDAAGTLMNMGNLAELQLDYVSANRYLLQAFEVQRKIAPNSEYSALVLSGLGDVALHEGDLRAAAEYKKEALELYRKLKLGGLSEASELNSLGDIAARESNFEAALAYQHQALTLSEKSAPKGDETIHALQSLGKLETERQEYDSARGFYQRALEIQQQASATNPLDMARSLEGLGDVAVHAGRVDEAYNYHSKALALIEKTLGPDHPDVARELNRIAEIQLQTKGPGTAFATALRAETIGCDHLRLTIQGLSERQALLYASDRPASLDLLLSLLEQKLSADPQKVQQAWTAVVRSRALVFDEMAERHRAVSAGSDPALLELANELASAKQRLANLTIRSTQEYAPDVYRKLLDRTGSEVEEMERSFSDRSSAFRQRTLLSQVDLPQVSAALSPDAALVAYVRYNRIDLKQVGSRGTPSYGAFLLTSQGSAPQFVVLGSAKTIEDAWSTWNKEINGEARSALIGGNTEVSYREAGAVVRKAIWDPVAARLGKATDVFLVSDGVLQLLNIDSLPVGGNRYIADEPTLFHYVSTERDLTVTPSSHGSGMLALGNPDFNWISSRQATPANYRGPEGGGVPGNQSSSLRGSRSACSTFASLRFAPLPASGQEAEEVIKLWKNTTLRSNSNGNPSVTLTGLEANELRFKELSPGKRVLHLATHSFFLGDKCDAIPQTDRTGETRSPGLAAENPLLLSGLALAGANHREDPGRDGIVTAEEIALMDLDGVDLAVLSACDTGRGEVRTGEGVFGLRRAFQLAGANTVVMSLWPVDDEITRNWMLSMYQGWLVYGKSTAAAVRLANREILNQRRAKHLSTQPFYWAAFIAVGNRN